MITSVQNSAIGFIDASVLVYASLSGGMSIEEMLKQWPELERADIYQSLRFAATLMQENFVPSQPRRAPRRRLVDISRR